MTILMFVVAVAIFLAGFLIGGEIAYKMGLDRGRHG